MKSATSKNRGASIRVTLELTQAQRDGLAWFQRNCFGRGEPADLATVTQWLISLAILNPLSMSRMFRNIEDVCRSHGIRPKQQAVVLSAIAQRKPLGCSLDGYEQIAIATTSTERLALRAIGKTRFPCCEGDINRIAQSLLVCALGFYDRLDRQLVAFAKYLTAEGIVDMMPIINDRIRRQFSPKTKRKAATKGGRA